MRVPMTNLELYIEVWPESQWGWEREGTTWKFWVGRLHLAISRTKH
jgi:hypothetical protein